MDQLKKDIQTFLNNAPPKENLRIRDQQSYFKLVQRYSELSNNEDTLLSDVKQVQAEINKLTDLFRDV